MDTRKDFENILMVNKAIHYIYRALGAGYVRGFSETFYFNSNDIPRDNVIGAQYLAKKIANHYRLPVKAVVVTFTSSLKQPAIVELSSSDEFFVELQHKYRSDTKSIAAILAHEIAHIFLHKSNIRFPVELDNEILTDTVAVYFGFGPTILNAATQKKVRYLLTLLKRMFIISGTFHSMNLDISSLSAMQHMVEIHQVQLRLGFQLPHSSLGHPT